MKLKALSSSCVVVAGVSIFSSSAIAVEATALAYASVEATDNVRQVGGDNAKSEVVELVGIVVGINESRKSFQADANFKLEREHYVHKTFSDETTLTTGFGLLNIGFVESFLDWRNSFSRTEVLDDPLASDNPDSRGYRNIFRSGPAIEYTLSPAANLSSSIEYINVENSNDNVSDSERLEGSLSLGYAYNRVTSFGLQARAEDVIDADEGDPYTNIRLSFDATRSLANGKAFVSLGATSIEREGQEDIEGVYAKIELQKDQFLAHRLLLVYTQDITDTTSGVESDLETQALQSSTGGVSGSDIVKREKLRFILSRPIDNMSYRFLGGLSKEDYGSQINDKLTRLVGAGIDFQYSSLNQIGLSYDYEWNRYLRRPEIDREESHSVSLDLAHNLSKKLFVSTKLSYRSRHNSSASPREYEEWSMTLGLNWELK